jgi:hypothetical protein
VRGGSWIGYKWFARSTFCNWSIPLMFNDDLGFRVVIAPPKRLTKRERISKMELADAPPVFS